MEPSRLAMWVAAGTVGHFVLYWSVAAWLHFPVAPSKWTPWIIANQYVVNPLFFALWFLYVADPDGAPMPWLDSVGVSRVVLQALVVYLTVEVLFWATHRAFHAVPLLYRLHKVHHRHIVTEGPDALDAHPLEHVVCNLLPVAAGPALAGLGLQWTLAWLGVATINTVVAHDRFDSHHGRHHLLQRGNYGIDAWMDRLMGTVIH